MKCRVIFIYSNNVVVGARISDLQWFRNWPIVSARQQNSVSAGTVDGRQPVDSLAVQETT